MSSLDFDDADYKSKSQIKREMHQLQALGERLIEYSVDKLQQLELSDSLLQAVIDAKNINQRGARKRQLQYIGRIMRDVDAISLEQRLNQLTETKHRKNTPSDQNQLQLDKHINHLLQQGDVAVSQLVDQFPEIDRQQLRNLIRNTNNKNTEKAQRAIKQLRLFLSDSLTINLN